MGDERGGDPKRLEQGLRQLRALGYLQSPAEVFVARRMPRRGGALRSTLAVGTWVGGGGGGAVGLLLWLAALLASPGLIDRPGEAGWLLLQMVAVVALGGALLVCAVTWPLFVRMPQSDHARGTRLVRASLLLTALLVAAYVADVLGRHLLQGLPRSLWPAVLVGLAALAATVGSWLAELMAVMVAAARLRVAREPAQSPQPRAPAGLLWLPGLCVALVLLGFGPYTQLRPVPRLDELPKPPTAAIAGPLLVVAIDGLALSDVQELAAHAPASLLGVCGAQARSLRADRAARAPTAFWNEIATGLPARIHGLSGAAATLPVGVRGEVSGLLRDPVLSTVSQRLLPGVGLGRLQASDQRELLRPPFWEIATWAGRRVLVVNWWATYPAAQHPPLEVVTDRWFLRLWDGDPAALADSLLSAPRDLAAQLLGGMRDAAALLELAAQRRLQLPAAAAGDSLLALDAPGADAGAAALSGAWRYATSSDALHVALAQAALGHASRDVVVVHLNGLDILDRRVNALARSAGRSAGVDPQGRRRSVQLRDLYIRYLDALLQPLARAAPAGRLLLVGSAEREPGREVWAWATGPAVLEPSTDSMWELVSVLLADLGIPPSREMHAPWPPAERTGAWALPRPATYGQRPDWTPRVGRARQDLEGLRSLGYIGVD
jgi:hypothetical protein